MGITVIKQPDIYIGFEDRIVALTGLSLPVTLISCECDNLMEKYMGLCDMCIERESLKMQSGLIKLMEKWKENGYVFNDGDDSYPFDCCAYSRRDCR